MINLIIPDIHNKTAIADKILVGHTPQRRWREHKDDYCLDTGLQCIGILENGELTIKYI